MTAGSKLGKILSIRSACKEIVLDSFNTISGSRLMEMTDATNPPITVVPKMVAARDTFAVCSFKVLTAFVPKR